MTFRQSTTHTTPSKTKSPISSLAQKLFAIGPSSSAQKITKFEELTWISNSREFYHYPINPFLGGYHLFYSCYTHILE
jgi:hypothetical protein